MRCYRKILHISHKDHVTKEKVHAKIQQAIGPHEDLITTVKRRKLQWYCHVSCSSGLVKTILQGTVEEGRRQGRQRKRWEDNIREWTGLEFAKSHKWRKLVAKSSLVPQRSLRLRDRWEGRRWERTAEALIGYASYYMSLLDRYPSVWNGRIRSVIKNENTSRLACGLPN